MPKAVANREDAIYAVLDRALTHAEDELEELLPSMSTSEIKERFAQMVETHLAVELENVRNHGHRNDDPLDVPPEE